MSSWLEPCRALALAAAVLLSATAANAGPAKEIANGPVIPFPDAAIFDKVAPAVKAQNKLVGHYGYGKLATQQEIAGWSIAVRPDGEGLPPGHGTVSHGGDIFANQCAICHGTFGEGEGRYPKLASDSKLTGERPTKAVGNYWPYATILWDYINRAMPFPAPHSLSADDVYALSAYILNLNNVVPDNFVADRNSLPRVQMPNRHGILWGDPRPDTHDKECMKNCIAPSAVKIASTAENSQVTPHTSGPLDEMAGK